jgi:choline dehydrogenase-like flavoprotein
MAIVSNDNRDVSRRLWDVAIVGAGLGGATAGFELARRGHSVLFLERGRLQSSETTGARVSADTEDADHLRRGHWPVPLAYHDGGNIETFRHPLGCGTGGSSAIFSMVMERFRAADFRPKAYCPDATSSTSPEAWPITYADLEPYYTAAECMYRVRGTPDPLFADTACLDPRPPTDYEQVLLTNLADSGLHPYRFHWACDQVPDCKGCFDRLCPRQCRRDAHRVCVRPALEQFGASLIAECRVDALVCPKRRVEGVIGDHAGRELHVKARIVMLAANSFVSPLILLRSRNTAWPDGLANRSGMVGRNLMLHASDYVWVGPPRADAPPTAPLQSAMSHGIGVNDFYVIGGVKHGNIHAHPRVQRTPEGESRTQFATIVEDLPYADNRVLAEHSTADHIAYAYHVRDELRVRASRLLSAFSHTIGDRLQVTNKPGVATLNRSHACGTLRFGEDAERSVLDPTNRAHEIDNLYAVDASFFPSSGGINPSLTIAANALRVASIVSDRL